MSLGRSQRPRTAEAFAANGLGTAIVRGDLSGPKLVDVTPREFGRIAPEAEQRGKPDEKPSG